MKKILLIILNISSILVNTVTFAGTPYNELRVEQADLKKYPTTISTHEPGIEVTIGDLHGNALKLLYFLIRNDVVSLTETKYEQFISVYEKPPEQLTPADMILFQSIMDAMDINNQHKIRFLGDDLCDRGMNDYYTLHIYKKLDNARVPFDIVLSNHGNFFITAFELPEQSFNHNPYGEGQNEDTVQSMLNLGKIIDKGIVNKQEVITLIQTHYLKHLVLPGYTANKDINEITIYSHAPIDVAMLAALAKDIETPFDASNLEELTKSLDGINVQIQKWIMGNEFSFHYNFFDVEYKQKNSLSPLKQVLWNRNYSILDRSHFAANKSYSLNYVHGHDSAPHVFDLDNLLGKGPDQSLGPYAVYMTHG